MDFRINDNIDEVMLRYFQSYSLMLDTPDFVPGKVLDKISRYLYKNMKKSLRKGKKLAKKLIRADKRKARKEKMIGRWKKFKSLFIKK